MTSVLHGGRRRRRPGAQLARLLLALAPLAVAAALLLAVTRQDSTARDGRSAAMQGAPAQLQGPPSSAPLAGGGADPADTRADPGAETPGAAAPDATEATLAGVDAFHLRFERPPKAGLVFDLDSGEVLWRHRPLRRLAVASLTKVMTALVVVENTEPREPVRITKSALRYEGSGVGLLPKGRHVTVEALLHGMLLPSGNDAAQALAEHVGGGSRAAFVAMMNERAQALGLRCTRFASPSGLSDDDRSCAADLAALTRLAMKQWRIKRVVRKAQAAVRFPIKGGRLFVNNTNPLVRTGYRGAIGLKTGYSREAGRCLIAVVRRGGRTLAAVVLGSPDPQLQVRRLFAKAFYV